MIDNAISVLKSQLENNGVCNYIYLKNHPFYDKVRSDPRFQEILAKHNKIYEENLEKYGDIDI
jgi:hypothetical protein